MVPVVVNHFGSGPCFGGEQREEAEEGEEDEEEKAWLGGEPHAAGMQTVETPRMTGAAGMICILPPRHLQQRNYAISIFCVCFGCGCTVAEINT